MRRNFDFGKNAIGQSENSASLNADVNIKIKSLNGKFYDEGCGNVLYHSQFKLMCPILLPKSSKVLLAHCSRKMVEQIFHKKREPTKFENKRFG